MLLVISGVTGCRRSGSGEAKVSEWYRATTYRSQQWGCIVYCRDSNGKVLLLPDQESTTGITRPGGKVAIPDCRSWGVIVVGRGMLTMLVAELNEIRVPEIMILDEKNGPYMDSTELAALSRLTTVKRLDLRFCPLITDGDLGVVKEVTNLSTVFLPASDKITDAELSRLKAARPSLQCSKWDGADIARCSNENLFEGAALSGKDLYAVTAINGWRTGTQIQGAIEQ
jgi:hypothetical protein